MIESSATRSATEAQRGSGVAVGDSGALRNRIVGSGEEAPDQLVANPLNWRIHPQAQQKALRGSLETVGWVQQVLVNRRTGNLVDGHARVEEALSRGEATVPVLYVDLDPDEEALVLATLDPIAAMAATDEAKLRELLADLTVDDAGLSAMLDKLSPPEPKVGLTDPDDVPDLGKGSNIHSGDIFVLGKHRLMCGDATSEADVDRLLDGQHVDLCLTDPPYGADIQYASHDDTQDALVGLIAGFFPLARRHSDLMALTPGINNVWLYERADWMLCWFYAAGTGRTPWGFSAWQPVLVWGKDPKLANGEGAHPDGYNWPMTKADGLERQDIDHACPKPVSSWMKWIERLSNQKSESILDPFMGSGTTMIAAEKLGRTSYGMEIDPRYVAVAIERWEKFTGKTAERIDG